MYEIFSNESDNLEILNYYNSHENILVKSGGGKNKAVIFFTGHGLYFPTTIEQFRKSVGEDEKFEWVNLSESPELFYSANKFVYVRDVYKNWCIDGINGTVNTQDRLAAYLKDIVGDMEVVTVGSSAGGFMAILFGILLNAKTIYAFSPQVNLHGYHLDHPINYYDEYIQTPSISKYMDLTTMMQGFFGDIFYFSPSLCEEDVRQYNYAVKCKNVHFFRVKEKRHGYTIWGECMIRTLSLEPSKLVKLSEYFAQNEFLPETYALKTIGLYKTVLRQVKKFVRKYIIK